MYSIIDRIFTSQSASSSIIMADDKRLLTILKTRERFSVRSRDQSGVEALFGKVHMSPPAAYDSFNTGSVLPFLRAIISVEAFLFKGMSALTPDRAFFGIDSPATPSRTSKSKSDTEAARIIASSLSVRAGILRTKTFSNYAEQCCQ